MKSSKKPPQYAPEQVNEIIDRINTLRARWLSLVTQRIGRPSSSMPDRSRRNAEHNGEPERS
jgi:hypothetical protein